MTQEQAIYDEAVEAALDVRDYVLKALWQAGPMSQEMAELQRLLQRNVDCAEEVAHACRTGVATLRRGVDSPRVLRLIRDTPGKAA